MSLPEVIGCFSNRRTLGNTGVVNQNISPAFKELGYSRERLLHATRIGNIASYRQNLHRKLVGNFLSYTFNLRERAGSNGDVGAFLPKSHRDGATDAAPTPGDYRESIREFHQSVPTQTINRQGAKIRQEELEQSRTLYEPKSQSKQNRTSADYFLAYFYVLATLGNLCAMAFLFQ